MCSSRSARLRRRPTFPCCSSAGTRLRRSQPTTCASRSTPASSSPSSTTSSASGAGDHSTRPTSRQQMAFALADSTVFGTADEAADFVDSVLGASTEYWIIGLDLAGTILLWNGGARRLYGYEARDVVGKANVSLLHTPEDVAVGKPAQIAEDALRHGKWEGIVERRRQDGTRFPARVVVNRRRNRDGEVVGLALVSTDVSEEVRQTRKLEESRRAEE